jgi:hypothetical protein
MTAADYISDYLLTGMHHGTPEGKKVINNIVEHTVKEKLIEYRAEGPGADTKAEEVIPYLKSLKDGEKVISITKDAMWGKIGAVYHNESGSLCVRWDVGDGKTMGTTVLFGTRRLIR